MTISEIYQDMLQPEYDCGLYELLNEYGNTILSGIFLIYLMPVQV